MNKTTLALFLALASAVPSRGDVFILKDGTKLNATITKEDADSYLLEVQVTASIKDERKVLKADVEKVEREQKDLKAFEEIKKMLPAPDLLTEEEYAAQVATIDKFLKDFKTSSKIREAKAIQDKLKAEAAQVAAGGVKVNGEIVPADQYQANAYELDARVQDAKIRMMLARNQTLLALRAFTAFEKDYRTTLPYGGLAPLILQSIKNYAAEARELKGSLDARLKTRAAGLSRMSPDDRRIAEAALAEENQLAANQLKTEKADKVGWVTLSPYSKEALEEGSKFADAELKRLTEVKTVLGVDGGKAYREVWAAVKNDSPAAAVNAAMAAARTAAVPARYTAPLEAEAKGRK